MAESQKGILRGLWDTFFSKSWPMWVGGILLGVGNICLFLVLKPWGASGGIANWGKNVFNSLGIVQFASETAPLATVSAFPYSV
ncbi:MAG: YeeE/YedE family protein, partial [Proteobacteria bacterium]|nr:YeeE/YedE family protein [Pseudomonadota bacterium]